MESTLAFRVRCVALSLLLSGLSGSLCAAFTRSLELATALRFAYPALFLAAPAIGVITAAIYRCREDQCGRGNDLLFERINQQNGSVPQRMAPLIFLTSTAAHLCGASVGREGAAVQIGGGLATSVQHLFRLSANYQRPLLLSGIAAGFGAIFGTPLAAAVFAIEAPSPKRWRLRFLPLCLLSGFAGDAACRAWGIHHATYPAVLPRGMEALPPTFWAALVVVGLCCGWGARLYLQLTETLLSLFKKTPRWWAPPLLTGLALCVLAQFAVARDYLGLGVWSSHPDAVTLGTAFQQGGALPWSWLIKLVLTAVCLSGGFKGGEVTPLFFVGATLGNALGTAFGQEPATFAAFGFVAVFSAAGHTPISGVFLAVELFGVRSIPWFAVVCVVATLACGKRSLFPSQCGG
jgi:H+/Cl- antiporter ClcA